MGKQLVCGDDLIGSSESFWEFGNYREYPYAYMPSLLFIYLFIYLWFI
jgi:hypothetical protein